MATPTPPPPPPGDGQPAKKKMKRTSFSPWSSTAPSSSKAAAAVTGASAAQRAPQLARVVSDIGAPSGFSGPTPTTEAHRKGRDGSGSGSGLAANARIMDAQRVWEAQQKATGGGVSSTRSSSTGSGPVSASPVPLPVMGSLPTPVPHPVEGGKEVQSVDSAGPGGRESVSSLPGASRFTFRCCVQVEHSVRTLVLKHF